MTNLLNEWLEAELKNRGWSLRELARRSDVAVTYISNILNGRQEPGAKFFQGVSRALGISTRALERLNEDGVLPPGEDITLRELWEMVEELSPEDRKEIISYASYRIWKKQHDSEASGEGPANAEATGAE